MDSMLVEVTEWLKVVVVSNDDFILIDTDVLEIR